MDKRQCSCCGEMKPVSEFYKDGVRNGKIRYRRDCKKCYNDSRKATKRRLLK